MVSGVDVNVNHACVGGNHICIHVSVSVACVCGFPLLSSCMRVCSVSAGLGVYSLRINESSTVPPL